MNKDYPLFDKIKTFILSSIMFLFLLFFLPTTQDFFGFNKLYLLAAGALSLILVSSIEVFVTKKIIWQQNKIDKVIILFCLAVGLSTFLASPNKYQAVLSVNFGLVMILALAVISFYLVRVTQPVKVILRNIFLFSTAIAGLFEIFFYFQPFKTVDLPTGLAFLKVPYFNTVGTLIDLSMLLGFALTIVIAQLVSHNNETSQDSTENPAVFYIVMTVVSIALVLSLYGVIKPLADKTATLPYPPMRLSWAAAIDTLKNPLNAVFGIGSDNFSAIFTHEKDVQYNQSNQWQISSFNVSRSTVLHILTEGGLLSLVALVIMILISFKQISEEKSRSMRFTLALPLIYTITLMLLFPPSIYIFFIFFLATALTSHHYAIRNSKEMTLLDATTIAPIYIGLALIGAVIIIASSFLLGKAYLAEYYFRNAIVADSKGDLQKVYDYHVKAIVQNPYIEKYRISFSQVNLFIANSIASKAQKQSGTSGDNKSQAKLSDKDKSDITERIQLAIAESKDAVTLNPQKAVNVENLAALYRNLLSVAQGSDAWTVAAYQRAIAMDPNNPSYRLNLGGVYYTLGDYTNAQNLFAQAATLKPDWPNAYYNLAWASYQKKDIKTAVDSMQNVLTLLGASKDSADYKKAATELAEFKNKLSKEEEQAKKPIPTATPVASAEAKIQRPKQLSLPTPDIATVEPKIRLPKTASPSAR